MADSGRGLSLSGPKRCNALYNRSVCGGAVRTFRANVAFLAVVVFLASCLASCSREPELGTPAIQISVPSGDVAGELSWSPDRRCAAFVISNRDGHSPLTTTRVGVVEPGVDGYREVRLPAPNERFSTILERWESPGVLRVHATTPDAELSARYSCSSRKLELIP